MSSTTSSVVISWSFAVRSMPSSGMQYRHRRLHFSVRLMRRYEWCRPCVSVRSSRGNARDSRARSAVSCSTAPTVGRGGGEAPSTPAPAMASRRAAVVSDVRAFVANTRVGAPAIPTADAADGFDDVAPQPPGPPDEATQRHRPHAWDAHRFAARWLPLAKKTPTPNIVARLASGARRRLWRKDAAKNLQYNLTLRLFLRRPVGLNLRLRLLRARELDRLPVHRERGLVLERAGLVENQPDAPEHDACEEKEGRKRDNEEGQNLALESATRAFSGRNRAETRAHRATLRRAVDGSSGTRKRAGHGTHSSTGKG